MVGLRGAAAATLVALAVLGTSARAAACSFPPPPLALVGVPEPEATGVPTDVVPVFSSVNANIYDEEGLSAAGFRIVAESGEVVHVTPLVTYAWHFELLPDVELSPSTEYTIEATLRPAEAGSPTTASLRFTTGDGPLRNAPGAPDAGLQNHYFRGSIHSSCDPNGDGFCLFFARGTALEVTNPAAPMPPWLIFEPSWSTLGPARLGPPIECVTLRTRGTNGAMSSPVEMCREDAADFTVTDFDGLECTEQGLARNGVPLGADESSRLIVTQGCGCRVLGSPRSTSATKLALAAFVVLAGVRRRARRA